MMYARAKARPQMTFVRGWELELHLGVQALGRKTEREGRKREGRINEDARLRDDYLDVRWYERGLPRTRKFSQNENL